MYMQVLKGGKHIYKTFDTVSRELASPAYVINNISKLFEVTELCTAGLICIYCIRSNPGTMVLNIERKSDNGFYNVALPTELLAD